MPQPATRNRTSRLFRAGRAVLGAVVLLALTVSPAFAGDYGYYGGGHSYGGGYSGGYHGGGGGYHGGGHGGGYKPTPQRSYSYSHTTSRSAYYRSGGYGFGWLGYNGGRDNYNGYDGPNTFINTPHRSDWYAKLEAQRRWDDMQYRKYQQAQNGGSNRCGFTNSPAYCYKLLGPYPSELRIVRY